MCIFFHVTYISHLTTNVHVFKFNMQYVMMEENKKALNAWLNATSLDPHHMKAWLNSLSLLDNTGES